MREEEQAASSATPKQDRPYMPKEYGLYGFVPSKTEGLLPWPWVTERMMAARNYWISSTRPDGRPHAMPVWGLWLNEFFSFSTGRSSRKGRNLAANPEVVIHLESGDEVVIFEGRVEEIEESAWLARFAEPYEIKYNFKPEPSPLNAYFRLDPHVVLAWRESDFPQSATRWRF